VRETGVATTYYLDDRLALAERTCRYPSDSLRRETADESFYVLAIRRRGYRECVFRFSVHDRDAARSVLDTLNRHLPKAEARSESPDLGLVRGSP
jgi:hypothetical protein